MTCEEQGDKGNVIFLLLPPAYFTHLLAQAYLPTHPLDPVPTQFCSFIPAHVPACLFSHTSMARTTSTPGLYLCQVTISAQTRICFNVCVGPYVPVTFRRGLHLKLVIDKKIFFCRFSSWFAEPSIVDVTGCVVPFPVLDILLW